MYKCFFKRFFDILISLIALPFVLLIILIFAPIIHFTDGGSVFYNAPRMGRNNKMFKMFKFRSMRMNAPDIRNSDGTTYNSENDPRVTKVGRFMRKTSIDELPQIFNVLIGNMSLIGPRPDTRIGEFADKEELYRTVRPGITGYIQAYYRNNISTIDAIEGNIYYAQNVSLLFDVKILLKTVAVVVKSENIYRNTGDPVSEQTNAVAQTENAEETLTK